MAKKLYEESDIQDIAVAIRYKNGESTKYKTRDMAAAIEAIPTGGALPVAHASIGGAGSYIATDAGSGCTLPNVQTGSEGTWFGKGRQIVFIPYGQNQTNAPTLQLNGGEVIPIRIRSLRNQGDNDKRPDATLPVPVGVLMRGVPYTLTFCGKYWLVDSHIAATVDIAGAWENVETVAPTKDADGSIALKKDGLSMTLPIPKEMATVAYIDRLVPSPTAADVGKLLTVSADGSAGWTDMHGVGISTSETVVSDISSDEKLITPAAVQKLISKINPAPIIITRNSNCDGTERDFLSTKQYQVGDRCTKIVMTEGKFNSHLYECVTAHLGQWDASDFNDLGYVFTAQGGVDMNDYLDAIKAGNFKARIDNLLYLQTTLSDLTGRTKSVQVQNVSSKGALGLGIRFGTDGSILGIIATFVGVAST